MTELKECFLCHRQLVSPENGDGSVEEIYYFMGVGHGVLASHMGGAPKLCDGHMKVLKKVLADLVQDMRELQRAEQGTLS
jgi:hypothetical protein